MVSSFQLLLLCLSPTVGDLAAKREGGHQKLAAGAVVGALPVLLESGSSSGGGGGGGRDPRATQQTRMTARTVALVVKVSLSLNLELKPDPKPTPHLILQLSYATKCGPLFDVQSNQGRHVIVVTLLHDVKTPDKWSRHGKALKLTQSEVRNLGQCSEAILPCLSCCMLSLLLFDI